ncbi:MAG: ATP-binding protein [Gemmatimonadota bacterium]
MFADLTAARHRLEELEAPGDVEAPLRDEADAGASTSEMRDRVRVPFAKLDALLAEVGELMGETLALERRLAERGGRELRDEAEAIRRRSDRLREAVMALRLVPIGRVLSRFHGLVRRLAAEQGKEARLVVEGEGTELDKSTADALAEPMLHLVRNAIDHGIGAPEDREAAGKPRHGTVWIRASQEGDRIRLEVADDGEGLDRAAIRERAREAGLVESGSDLPDAELTRLILRPGFSTRSDVSTVSGRGVGLDVVRRRVRDLRGDLDVGRTAEGGTRFVLRLPLTVAVVPSVMFETAGELLALPAGDVVRTVHLDGLERVGAAPVLRDDGRLVPVVDADRLFGWPVRERGSFGLLIADGTDRVVLSADRLIDRRDLVVKALPRYGAATRAVTGGSVLPGGRVILLLDPAGVIDLSEQEGGRRSSWTRS